MTAIPWIDRETMTRVLPWVQVVDALESALVSGVAPGNTPPRTFVPVSSGELLLMPGEVGSAVGVKVLAINDRADHFAVPRIQGVHIAFDGDSLRPTAILDAEPLTLLRTAGLSALAVRHLAPPSAASLLVFGAGPQAVSHALAINAVRPLERVLLAGRRQPAVDQAVSQLRAAGLDAHAGDPTEVADVDIVACCTTAAEPVFSSTLLRPEAAVVAIGSHSPHRREVDTQLVERATVIVESQQTALSQAGDIILALSDGVAGSTAITGDLRALVTGSVVVVPGAPRLFKSVGEAWCDVVVATAVVEAALLLAPT